MSKNLTPKEVARLATAEAAFQRAGGRGVELADEIDALRRKRDGLSVDEMYVVNESLRLMAEDEFGITLTDAALDDLTHYVSAFLVRHAADFD